MATRADGRMKLVWRNRLGVVTIVVMVAVLLPQASVVAADQPRLCNGVPATIVGTPGDDKITGTDGVDVIAALQGNDIVRALGGDDIVCAGLGNDTVYGGNGFDILFGAQGDDVLYASNGSSKSQRSDVRGARMFGGKGNDLIYGSTRWDRMQGGPGVDRLFGFEGRDWMRAGPDRDHLDGGPGIDDLHGGNGPDTIIVSTGDSVRGGAGLDRCVIGVASPADLRSCGRDRLEERRVTGPGVVVTVDNSERVERDEVESAATDEDGTVAVVLETTSEPADALEQGDVVFIEPSEDLPSGHVGRVSSVADRRIESEPIPVQEAIPEIDVSGTTPLRSHGGGGQGLAQPLNFLSAFERECGINRGASMESTFSLVDSRLEYEFSWGAGKPTRALLVAHYGAELETDFALDLAGECTFELEIGPEWEIWKGFVPSTPIPMRVTLQGEVEVTLSAAVTVMEGNGRARLDLSLGFDYLDGEATAVKNADLTTELGFTPGPGISGETEIMIGAAVDLEIGGKPIFFGLGATAELEYFAGGAFIIKVDPRKQPWWTADLALKANVEVELQVTGALFGKTKTLLDAEIRLGSLVLAEKRLAQAGGPYEGPTIATRNLPTASFDEQIESQLESSGGTAPIHWSALGLPQGLILSSDGVLSGSTKQSGSHQVTITVEDRAEWSDARVMTLSIGSPNFAGKLVVSGSESWYVDYTDFWHAVPDGGVFECIAAQGRLTIRDVPSRLIETARVRENAACVRADDGSIISTNDGDSHLLSDGKLRSISDSATFDCLAREGRKKVDGVPRYWVVEQTKGADITRSCFDAASVRGTIVESSENSESWFVDNRGGRHAIPDGGIYQCLQAQGKAVSGSFRPQEIEELTKFENAQCVRVSNGQIAHHPDGDSYLMEGGRLRHLKNGGIFNCLKGRGANVVEGVPRYWVLDQPRGTEITTDVCNAILTVGSTSWYIDGAGARHWIPDQPTFWCWQARGLKVQNTTNSVVGKSPRGRDSTCFNLSTVEGKMLKLPAGDIHFITGDNRSHWVPDTPTRLCLENQGHPVVDIKVESYVTGRVKGDWAYCTANSGGRAFVALRGSIFRYKTPAGDLHDAHYIDRHGFRHWIATESIVSCLRNSGVSYFEVRHRQQIDELHEPDGQHQTQCRIQY